MGSKIVCIFVCFCFSGLSNGQDFYLSGGLTNVQSMSILQEATVQYAKLNLNMASKVDRITAAKLLVDAASMEVTGTWNALICERNTCDWNFLSCGNLYLVVAYRGYFVHVFQCDA